MIMKLPVALLLAASAALFVPQGAIAQSSEELRYNIRCLAVISALYKSDDPKHREAAKIGGTYFAAKVFAINPNIDIRAAVKQESAYITEGSAQAIGQSCAQELIARGQQLKGQTQAQAGARPAPRRPVTPPRTEREVTIE